MGVKNVTQTAEQSSALDYILPRNPVTKNREVRLVPEIVELALGRLLYSSMIRSQGGRCLDGSYQGLLQKVGKRIAGHTDRTKLPYEFTVINSSQINAWCLPGGKVAFYRGIIEKMDQEKATFGVGRFSLDEKVAAVMSHELTHAAARHSARGLEFSMFLTAVLQLVRYSLSVFIEQSEKAKTPDSTEAEVKPDTMMQIAQGIDLVFLYSYDTIFNLFSTHGSRQHELEADKYGMVYLKRSGYNPKAAIWLQEFFAKNHSHSLGFLDAIFNLFSTHPSSKERAAINRKTYEEIKLGRLK